MTTDETKRERYCAWVKCPHLAKKNWLFCKPHRKSNIKKNGHQGLFKDAYSKLIIEMMAEESILLKGARNL